MKGSPENKTACHYELSEKAFKILRNVFAALNIPFSGRYNASYGIDDALQIILSMSSNNRCASAAKKMVAMSGVRAPTSQWLLGQLGKVPYDTMETGCHAMLLKTLRQARSRRLYTIHGTLAIDKHLIKRYDKKPNLFHLIKSKFLRGTSNFEAYITGYMFNGIMGCHVAVLPVTRGGFNADFVRKIIAKCRKCNMAPSLVLLDREFYSVYIMNVIAQQEPRFLMPAVKNSGVKKAVAEYVAGRRNAVSQYVLRSSDGSSCPFNLVIVPKKGSLGEHLVFATNMHVDHVGDMVKRIPEEYRQRWSIETGYRVTDRARPRTCSRNPAIRLLMFYMSMYNLWSTANFLASENPRRRGSKYITLDELLAYYCVIVGIVDPKRSYQLEAVS